MFDFEKNDFWNDPLLVLGFLSTLLVIIFIRYFAFAYFYQAILARFTKRNQNIFNLKKIQIRREIKWSFLSSLVFTLFIPIHFIILLTVLMLMTVSAVINHSGVEIFHKKFILNNLIGSFHHDLHHTEFKTNFGLYFTWWNKCMKTESKKPLKNTCQIHQ